jgi:hypothetical protein
MGVVSRASNWSLLQAPDDNHQSPPRGAYEPRLLARVAPADLVSHRATSRFKSDV